MMLYEMFRCFGAVSLVSLGAIAIGETMFSTETSVREMVRKLRERGAR